MADNITDTSESEIEANRSLTEDMPRQSTNILGIDYLLEDNTSERSTSELESEIESNILISNVNVDQTVTYRCPSEDQIKLLESNAEDMPCQSTDSLVSQECSVPESTDFESNKTQTKCNKAQSSDKDSQTEDMQCETTDSQGIPTESAFDQEDRNITIKQEVIEIEDINPELPDSINEQVVDLTILVKDETDTIDETNEQINTQEKLETIDVDEFDVLKIKLETLASKLQVSVMKPSHENRSQTSVLPEGTQQSRTGYRYGPRRGRWKNTWIRGQWGRLHRFERVIDPRTGECHYVLVEPHDRLRNDLFVKMHKTKIEVKKTTEELKKDNILTKTDKVEVKKEKDTDLISSESENDFLNQCRLEENREWSNIKVKQEKVDVEKIGVKEEVIEGENANIKPEIEEFVDTIVVKQEPFSSDDDESDLEGEQSKTSISTEEVVTNEPSKSTGQETKFRADKNERANIQWRTLAVLLQKENSS